MAQDRMTPRHTRKSEKQRTERQRRDEREQTEQLQDRAARETLPRDDWEPLPRID